MPDEDEEDGFYWENPAERPLKLKEGEWWQCPRRPVLDDPKLFVDVIRLRNIRETGFLPFPGSYMQQPNALIEAMSIVDMALAEAAKIKAKRGKAGQD